MVDNKLLGEGAKTGLSDNSKPVVLNQGPDSMIFVNADLIRTIWTSYDSELGQFGPRPLLLLILISH